MHGGPASCPSLGVLTLSYLTPDLTLCRSEIFSFGLHSAFSDLHHPLPCFLPGRCFYL